MADSALPRTRLPMRRLALLLAAMMITALVPEHAGAQAAGSAVVNGPCTYDTCALRVKRSVWTVRLVRGATGEPLPDRLTGGGGGVDVLLNGPDSAATYGRAYVGNQRRASAFGLLAIVGYAVAAYRSDNFRRAEDLGAVGTVALAGSIVGSIGSAVHGFRAQEQLSRGIWWYNASLPR